MKYNNELNKKIDNLYENFASEEKNKLSNQTEFELSDFFGINELHVLRYLILMDKLYLLYQILFEIILLILPLFFF